MTRQAAPLSVPLRGRPRGFDAEAGVSAARDLFAWRGYDAVSVADLCAVLGIRPPSLYAAYGSKRGLFDRVLARYCEGSDAAYAAALAAATSLPDLRHRILSTAAELFLRDGGIGCLVIANLASTRDAGLRTALDGVAERRMASIAARAAALGARDDGAEVAALGVAIMGLSAAARAGMDPEMLRGTVDRLAR